VEGRRISISPSRRHGDHRLHEAPPFGWGRRPRRLEMFVNIRKLDAEGNYVRISAMGAFKLGCVGTDQGVSSRARPQPLDRLQPRPGTPKGKKLKPGEIVPVDIEIWPHSRMWHKSEQLRVIVAGQAIRGNPSSPYLGSCSPRIRATTSSTQAAGTTRTSKFRSFRRSTRRGITCIGKGRMAQSKARHDAAVSREAPAALLLEGLLKPSNSYRQSTRRGITCIGKDHIAEKQGTA